MEPTASRPVWGVLYPNRTPEAGYVSMRPPKVRGVLLVFL